MGEALMCVKIEQKMNPGKDIFMDGDLYAIVSRDRVDA